MKQTTAKQMTAEAIEARRAYKREWYAKNKKHVEEYNAAYWERKAKERRENGKDKVQG
jgi:DNA polymerase elongation subunit (family B)